MQTETFGKELKRLGFCDFVGVPCSYLAPLINWAINENVFIIANNEGEAVAIASGISLANSPLGSTNSAFTQDTRIFSNANSGESMGDSAKNSSDSTDSRKFGVVLMQNSGLSNAISPLTSLNHTFEIPILGFVSLRGEPNERGENTDEPQHELLGKITDKILAVCQIEYEFLETSLDLAIAQLHRAKKALESNKSFFFIVRKSCFEKVELKENLDNSMKFDVDSSDSIESAKSSDNVYCHTRLKSLAHNDERQATPHKNTTFTMKIKPTRLSALQCLQNLAQNAALLATTGKCGRELYELGDRANYLYMVGSMGCVSSLALGISLKARKKIIAIDGDSALLMRLGCLSGNAFYAMDANKGNFCHILLDNESHDSTGGQFNLSPFTDFCAIAKNCGYAKVIKASDLGEFERAIETFLEVDSGGAWFVYLNIQKGSKKDLGRPKITPKQVALRFSAWLNQ